MQKIGIIGSGNMGSGIVQKTAREGLSVVMVDPGRGLRRIYLLNYNKKLFFVSWCLVAIFSGLSELGLTNVGKKDIPFEGK